MVWGRVCGRSHEKALQQQLCEDGRDSATAQTADTAAGLEQRYKGPPVVQGLRLRLQTPLQV